MRLKSRTAVLVALLGLIAACAPATPSAPGASGTIGSAQPAQRSGQKVLTLVGREGIIGNFPGVTGVAEDATTSSSTT
jgi:hypothetical protein